jgi:hypothetical protein
MEIDPRYCDVIIERYARHTRKTVTLADGRTFADLKTERVAA